MAILTLINLQSGLALLSEPSHIGPFCIETCLVLIPGSTDQAQDGWLDLSPTGEIRKLKGNLLVRLLDAFVLPTGVPDLGHGRIATLLLDRGANTGEAVDFMRQRFNNRVFVVGNSHGATRVSRGYLQLLDISQPIAPGIYKPDGVILIASIFKEFDEPFPLGFYETGVMADVTPLPLWDRNRLIDWMPRTLVIHHVNDACKKSEIAWARQLVANLGSKASIAKIVGVGDGITWKGDECRGKHAHGFPGQEGQVLDHIRRFVAPPEPLLDH